jgi:hypothetical protein
MAISYTLSVATTWPSAQVAGELHRAAVDLALLPASTGETQILDPGVVTASGTRLRVMATPPHPVDPVLAGLGFRPTLTTTFRFDKFRDLEVQTDDMVALVADLLDHVPGDLVLHHQYETIWLLRRGDDLSIGDRDGMWPPHRATLLGRPHHRRSLSFTDAR